MSMNADLSINIEDAADELIKLLNNNKLSKIEIKRLMLLLKINIKLDLNWNANDCIHKLQSEYNDNSMDMYLE